ncbi:MAG: hypothetical protein M1838_005954 [Thelocarpon superellum]|nr:MAG: hypothetical protein M1838_005954 [Thelocarpon superellum]
MSSPAAYPGSVPASTAGASAAAQDGVLGDSHGLCLKPMRLKVLYTFDDQNKTNCLARWPHVIQVQTVQLDETSTIGVIELKTCIQAIVSASPELVAKLGQDYTVYAYDYSEYETPLVGQGMLSWALASASPTPGAPAHQSRTMITGRVCKNILGLFSNGVKETLEVKLRLVAVPTCLQSDYLTSMERYRQISKGFPQGVDPTDANPQLSMADRIQTTTVMPEMPRPRDGAGVEQLRHMLEQGLASDHVTQSAPPPSAFEAGAMQGRVGSMVSRYETMEHDFRAEQPCRPRLHTVVKSEPSSRPASRDAPDSCRPAFVQLGYGDENVKPADAEEERGRKRVRVTQTNWSGKSTLESNAESLRVAASTAASVRVYRPIAMNPAMAPRGSLEPGPRAPTPRPERAAPKPSRLLYGAQSRLRHGSFDQGPGHAHPSIESSATSPDEGQMGSFAQTPIDITSSPPQVEAFSTAASSPGLPPLALPTDSGFMSGAIDDLFEEADDDEMRLPDIDDLEAAAHYIKRDARPSVKELTIEEVVPGPPELLPTKILPRPASSLKVGSKRSRSIACSETGEVPEGAEKPPASKVPSKLGTAVVSDAAHSMRPVGTQAPPSSMRASNPPARPLAPSRPIARAPSVGNVTLPSVTSDPIFQPIAPRPGPPGAGTDHATSDASVYPTADAARKAGPEPPKLVRSGSGMKRRKAIQKRLENAIEMGETPPYCGNCGAIETPTWRKAWAKDVPGTLDQIRPSEESGIIGVVNIDRAPVPSVTILKKIVAPSDQGFHEVQMCNPCGLWLHKFRSMRPSERWNKEPKGPDEKKRSRKRKNSTLSEITPSEGIFSRDVSAAPTTSRLGDSLVEASEVADGASQPGPARPTKKRANSVQIERLHREGGWTEDAAAAALARAIQSSPARLLGQAQSPIELDGLGYTKRKLFSSPGAAAAPAHQARWETAPARAGARGVEEAEKEAPPVVLAAPPMADAVPGASCPDPGNKENLPPIGADDLEELWAPLEAGGPTTPSRFASAGGGDLLLPPRTPSTRARTPPSEVRPVDPSPFTAHLHALLSGTDVSPSTQAFHNLPSIEEVYQSGGRPPASAMGFADVDVDHVFPVGDIFSTDNVMPSSPPAFFELYEDPVVPASGFWTEFEMPDGEMTEAPSLL